MSTKKLQILGSLGNKIYTQNDEPTDAADGSLWVDLDEEGVSTGGSTYVDDTLSIDGAAADAKTVGDRLAAAESQIADLLYKAISITSFTNNINKVELGSTVTDVALTWATSKTPTALTLDGSTLDVSLKSKELTNLNLTSTTNFVLKATDERGTTATRTTSVEFLNGIYYGAIDNGVTIDSDTILDLVADSKITKSLQSTKSATFTVTANDGQNIIYMLPTDGYGTPTFKDKDTGFEAGFYKANTIQFTNGTGRHTESYDIWLSTQTGLGAMTVVVS